MKLALIVPNFRWSVKNKDFLWDYIPYNLCLIAANLPRTVKVEILDCYKKNMSTRDLYTWILVNHPDVVGITIMIDQHVQAGLSAANAVKDFNSDIRVIIGGAAATTNADQLIHSPNIDIVIKGEGEHIVGSLIEKGTPPGIYTGRLGNCYQNMCPPRYNLIDLPSYINKPPKRKSVDSPRAYPYGRLLTSRGCPFGCCFCQVEHIMGKRWRGRLVDDVLDEIMWLESEYGIKSLVFDDDNMLHDATRAKALFAGMINRNLVMPWSMIATSVRNIDPEMVDLTTRSGCKYVDIAIESGVERVLKEIIHKPIDLDQAMEVRRLLRVSNIFTAANFIIGFPGETWQEIRETISYAEEFDADYTKIFTATPLRHTKLWKQCDDDKFAIQHSLHMNWRDPWREGLITTNEFDGRELTILRAFEWDRINFNNPFKKAKIARMMGTSIRGLDVIRTRTRRRVYE